MGEDRERWDVAPGRDDRWTRKPAIKGPPSMGEYPKMDLETAATMAAQWEEALEAFGELEDSLIAAIGQGSAPSAEKKQNQHFVPKFWLKDFVKDGHVAELDTAGPSTTCSCKGIKSVACRTNYYTMSTLDNKNDQWVEEYFGWFEGQTTRPEHERWTNLVQGKLPADPLGRLFVSLLLTSQYFRTPRLRGMLSDTAEQVSQKIVAHGQAVGAIPATDKPLEVKIDADASQEWLIGQSVGMLTSDMFDKLVRQIFNRRWSLYTSPDDIGWALPVNKPLICDGPGTLLAPEVWVPVSRRYILCMHWNYDISLPEGRTEALHPPVAKSIREATVRNDNQLVVHLDDAAAWREWCDTDPVVSAARRVRLEDMRAIGLGAGKNTWTSACSQAVGEIFRAEMDLDDEDEGMTNVLADAGVPVKDREASVAAALAIYRDWMEKFQAKMSSDTESVPVVWESPPGHWVLTSEDARQFWADFRRSMNAALHQFRSDDGEPPPACWPEAIATRLVAETLLAAVKSLPATGMI